MQTEAVTQILKIADEIRNNNNIKYLTGECIYLAVLQICDMALRVPEKYAEAEYQEMQKCVEEIQQEKGMAMLGEDELKPYMLARSDEQKQKWQFAFQIWLQMGKRTAAEVWTYVAEDKSMKYLYESDAMYLKKELKNVKESMADVSVKHSEMPERQTGEEIQNLSSIEFLVENTVHLREKLLENIVGQNHVVRKFADGYFAGEIEGQMNHERKGPRAIFVFAGSPGVGKTFLATEAARILGLSSKRFDMSGYANDGSAFELTGANNNYASPQPGALTGFVHDHPESLLIFDEIEKAHEKVIHLFLQILDAGFLYDNKYAKNISFSDAILIFTTNAGKQLYSDPEKYNFSDQPKKTILQALEKDINPATRRPFFPEAICSRLASGHVFMFNRLTASDLAVIADKQLKKQQEQFEKQFGIASNYCDDLASTILFSVGGQCDARTVVGTTKRFFAEEILELYRLMRIADPQPAVRNIAWCIAQEDMEPAVRELYEVPEDGVILFAGYGKDSCMVKAAGRNVLCAASCEELQLLMQEEDVTFAVVDYLYGAEVSADVLNAEDVMSEGRQMFDKLRKEYPELPVLIGETMTSPYSHEEKLSFINRGAYDILLLPENGDGLENSLVQMQKRLHQQRALETLALKHQVLSYETAQRISDDGETGKIELFSLHLSTAVEADERQNIVSAQEKPNLHWKDIVVSDDIKEELTFFQGYLHNPKAFLKKGARAPRGILMYGPPGTGKTSLAKVMASEADVTFLTVSADQFISRWAGEGPASVHRIFTIARKYAPAILFIDEIDAIGRRRTGEDTHDGKQEILNALLTEMDGFKTTQKKPILVMAATNLGGNNGNTGALDPALVRRFDRSICIDLPDKAGRTKLLHILCHKNPILKISESMVESLAERSVGMSPALLEGAVNAAVREAIRSDSQVTDEIMDEAFEKYNNGDEKKWDRTELLKTARHEAGHAFISHYYGEEPAYLTIVARDDHGGYMMHSSNETKGVYSRSELLRRIVVSMGGRAAEIVCYGSEQGLTTGASSDLENATRLARNMICSYGMYDEIAVGTLEIAAKDAALALTVQKKINEILRDELEEAIRILSDHKEAFDRLVDALMEKTHMHKEEIQAILM